MLFIKSRFYNMDLPDACVPCVVFNCVILYFGIFPHFKSNHLHNKCARSIKQRMKFLEPSSFHLKDCLRYDKLINYVYDKLDNWTRYSTDMNRVNQMFHCIKRRMPMLSYHTLLAFSVLV